MFGCFERRGASQQSHACYYAVADATDFLIVRGSANRGNGAGEAWFDSGGRNARPSVAARDVMATTEVDPGMIETNCRPRELGPGEGGRHGQAAAMEPSGVVAETPSKTSGRRCDSKLAYTWSLAKPG